MPKPKTHRVFQQGERWDECSETWPTSGTMRNGRLYPPRQSEHRTSESESLSLLPTPRTTDGNGAGKHGSGGLDLRTAALHGEWEKYKPAIERWERLTRDAPEPTEIGTQGKPRLNPRFSEWVMGWPEGWATDFINPTRKRDPDKVSRSAVLKMIGNGVVPQQAISALGQLMVRFDSNERK